MAGLARRKQDQQAEAQARSGDFAAARLEHAPAFGCDRVGLLSVVRRVRAQCRVQSRSTCRSLARSIVT